ncbi:pentapeptide repeat-containing protein [Peptoniphilus catoniae]|nr:pentapeptide repeat-containing protein [Peptoniphilus catoniae]
MKYKELNEILEKHKKWLNGDQNGERANLSNADLRRANLIGANLIG